MTRRATLVAAGMVVLVVALSLSLWMERHPKESEALQVAHSATVLAETRAAQAETVYIAQRASAAAARQSFHVLHDSVLMRITDTLLVEQTLASADRALTKDSIALVRADSSIAAERDVTTHVRGELAIALRPKIEPRLRTTLYGLYEPLTATAVASAQLSARVIGQLALVARADQRLTIGEKARLAVGASVSF